MKMMKEKKYIAVLLLVSMLCSSCGLFATQNMIDNIFPDYERRMYNVADLIPYNYKEVKNAKAYYTMRDKDFIDKYIATDSEMKKLSVKEQKEIQKKFHFRIHNRKTIMNRFAMYVDGVDEVAGTKDALREKEYNDYYAIGNAKGLDTIKKYNSGKVDGMPLMSIRADMSTATVSDTTDIYSEVMCEIYKPVVIENKKYDKLKIGDKIDLEIPATNSTVYCDKIIKKTCTYIATDSLLYKDADGKDAYYFIAETDGIVPCRRVLDSHGKTLETFTEKKPLQFMKCARVAEANEQLRLIIAASGGDLEAYNFDALVEKALCGGYLVYKYKDYVYANSITTNLKGYITSLTNYTNQAIDNKLYNELND